MALITQFGYDNLVTHEALSIRYSQGPKTDGGQYEVHRYTTKRFSFVGMTESGARNGAAFMAELTVGGRRLTRYYYIWKKGGDGKWEHDGEEIMLKDEIAAVHEEGPMWRIDVTVNEDDLAYVDEEDLEDNPATWPFPDGGYYWEGESES